MAETTDSGRGWPDTLRVIRVARQIRELMAGTLTVEISPVTYPPEQIARANVFGDGCTEYVASLPGAEWHDWYACTLDPGSEQRHITATIHGVEFCAYERRPFDGAS